jgi:hypothetical protein
LTHARFGVGCATKREIRLGNWATSFNNKKTNRSCSDSFVRPDISEARMTMSIICLKTYSWDQAPAHAHMAGAFEFLSVTALPFRALDSYVLLYVCLWGSWDGEMSLCRFLFVLHPWLRFVLFAFATHVRGHPGCRICSPISPPLSSFRKRCMGGREVWVSLPKTHLEKTEFSPIRGCLLYLLIHAFNSGLSLCFQRSSAYAC